MRRGAAGGREMEVCGMQGLLCPLCPVGGVTRCLPPVLQKGKLFLGTLNYKVHFFPRECLVWSLLIPFAEVFSLNIF